MNDVKISLPPSHAAPYTQARLLLWQHGVRRVLLGVKLSEEEKLGE